MSPTQYGEGQVAKSPGCRVVYDGHVFKTTKNLDRRSSQIRPPYNGIVQGYASRVDPTRPALRAKLLPALLERTGVHSKKGSSGCQIMKHRRVRKTNFPNKINAIKKRFSTPRSTVTSTTNTSALVQIGSSPQSMSRRLRRLRTDPVRFVSIQFLFVGCILRRHNGKHNASLLQSSATAICSAARKEPDEHAIKTGEEIRILVGELAKSKTATNARTRCKRAKHASSGYNIGEVSGKNLNAGEVWTVSSATNSRILESLFVFERLELPQITDSSSTWLHPPSDDVINIRKIRFH